MHPRHCGVRGGVHEERFGSQDFALGRGGGVSQPMRSIVAVARHGLPPTLPVMGKGRSGGGGARLPEAFMFRRHDSAGLTLVEVLVVLMVLAILAGLSLQGAGLLQAAINAGRTKGASDQLVTAIRYTRQRAISDAQDHCIATRTSGGVGQFEIYTGGRTATSCSGTSVEGPVDLTGAATVGNFAFRFSPVSTVDPVGPTDVVITSTGDGSPCSVTVTVTPEGGVRIPGTSC